jgi:hypothetical protein
MTKNTKRAFSKEVKEKVLDRDWSCIICGWLWEHFHHVLYWGDAEYWEDRNNANKLVLLCSYCHHRLHFEWNNDYRLQCKKYLWLHMDWTQTFIPIK